MSTAAETLRRTPLYEQHRIAGAKLVPFAGWEMPIQYTGIRPEHEAVRRRAGVFDVSHMGQIETRGPGAGAYLQRLLSNDVRRIPVGGAQYAVLCDEAGRVLEDLFTYRLAERRFLTVTNAANHARDIDWFRTHADGFDVDVIDRAADFALLAVQGPLAPETVAGMADTLLPPRMHVAEVVLGGVAVTACGTGYTGEPGYELLVAPADAPRLWEALIAAGVTPVGLGARDTLRLEVCFHLYGNDLDLDHGPIEAGLGWCCREDTGFIGAQAVAAARAQPPAERLVPFRIDGEGIARQGNPVLGGGVVTSGTFSPSLARGIGMAYVPADRAQPGSAIEIDVRGKTRSARIESKPLYRKDAR